MSNDEIPQDFPTCQLILYSKANETSIRHLDSDHIAKIVRVSGIIISASVLSSRATQVQLICRACKHTMKITVKHGFGQIQLPPRCLAPHNPIQIPQKRNVPTIPMSSFTINRHLLINRF